jgi:hypothetical protein
MEERLIPLNGVLALANHDGAWFADLANQGFRLHALEMEVQSEPSVIRADIVLYRTSPDLILLIECKSGRNVEQRQAQGYANADLQGLRTRASVPAELVGRKVEVAPVFAVLEQHRDNIVQSLRRCDVEAPVLEIGRGIARLAGPLPDGLASFERVDPRVGWPPVRVRLDRLSSIEEFMEVLVQQIAAAQARHETQLDLDAVCATIFAGLWPGFSPRSRAELRDRLKQSASALQEGEMGRSIRIEGGNELAPRLVILDSPAGADPRGAPQAWQGQQRRAASDLGRKGRPITERRSQLSFDDLVAAEGDDRDSEAETNDALGGEIELGAEPPAE